MQNDEAKTKKQLLNELQETHQRTNEVHVLETEQKLSEHDLTKRIKELRCFYRVVKANERPHITLNELCREVASLLPDAWQYPEITCARVIFNNNKGFETENWKETGWKQSSDIKVHGIKTGAVEVCYLEERLPIAEGPFLREERQLIDAVAEWLGSIIQGRQAEEYLRGSEEFNANLMRSSLSPVEIINPDTSVRYVNKAFEELTGFTAADIVGKKAPYPWWTDPPEKGLERLKRGMRTGSHHSETLFQKESGEQFWVELYSKPVRLNGELNYFLISWRDITERKQAEEALRRSEEFLSSLLSHAPNPILVLNLDTSIRYVNPALEEITGFTSAELIGRKAPYPWWSEETQKHTYMEVNQAMHQGMRNAKRPFQKKNGGLFWCELTAVPVFSKGEFKYSISSWSDITERERAEEELSKYRGHLEELVEQRTAELRAVNMKLEHEIIQRKLRDKELNKLYKEEKRLRTAMEQQMKRRVEFTRALVHELKTPITALLGASDMLVAHTEEEPYKTLIRNIQLGTLNLNRRIDDLVDLVRGEIGMLRLQYRAVNIILLLREIADYFYPEVTRKQQSLVTDLSPSLPLVEADEDRLRQVLLNLLNNALKFTPEGGKITLKTRQEDTKVIVEVQDTGCGISKSKQRRLFKPYFQQANDREQFSGLGLGLALCQTLIEIHGGQIKVESQVGKGSTFSFELPIGN